MIITQKTILILGKAGEKQPESVQSPNSTYARTMLAHFSRMVEDFQIATSFACSHGSNRSKILSLDHCTHYRMKPRVLLQAPTKESLANNEQFISFYMCVFSRNAY